MKRLQKVLLLGLAIAVPAAAAQAFRPVEHPCFAAGSTTYRVSASTQSPDYKVKIDNRAAHPDLRMQLIDEAAAADFVLVDDFADADTNACRTSMPLKTIRIDAVEQRPDLTISLATVAAEHTAPDFKLYVHSARFSLDEAAALFGIMWQATRSREIAQTR